MWPLLIKIGVLFPTALKTIDVFLKSRNLIPRFTKSNWITLDIGGKPFLTTKRTLQSTPSIFTLLIKDAEQDNKNIYSWKYWSKRINEAFFPKNETKIMIGAGGMPIYKKRKKHHINFDVYFQIRLKESNLWNIDRDPKYFAPVLNFFRHKQIIYDDGISLKGIMEEANYFCVVDMIDKLEKLGVKRPLPIPHAMRVEKSVNTEDVDYVVINK
eukprot:TRINITY_DN2298_c0_g1_i1.p1 TRINITY_DN2298_c0_g1~~TRINITY_DN2298_c0_g1_i1.p1  ORF type:complete len:213 (-),score=38.70 TRINITY_DN2298_c0_g1_i1:202-840(-)